MNEPNSEPVASNPFGPSELDFEEADRQLAQTQPWVRFVATLGFVMCVVSLANFLLTALPGMVPMTVVSAFALLVALLFYLVPSILLWNYGSRIGEYLRGSNSASFSEALTAQKTFWKYLGILALAIILLYFVIIAFVIAFTIGPMR